MKEFFKNVLSSSNAASSKRLVLLICVICIILMCFLNMFFKLSIEEFMFSGIITIVLTSLGVVGVENVSNNLKTKKDEEKDTNNPV